MSRARVREWLFEELYPRQGLFAAGQEAQLLKMHTPPPGGGW
jgi:hypothetical protein